MGKPQSFTGFNTLFGWAKYNSDGTISFGGVDKKLEKHAVLLLNNYDPSHFIKMGSSGANKSRTIVSSPRGMTVKCGQKRNRNDGTFVLQVENGNMIIDVQNGDFGVKARNINMRAEYGPGTKEGNLTLFANNKIREEGKYIELFGAEKIDITCNKLLKLMGDTEVQMISGICNMTSYSSRRGKKGDKQSKIIPGKIGGKKEEAIGAGAAPPPSTSEVAQQSADIT